MRHDLAWAAGLFEGEGCFAITRGVKGSIRLRAQIRMTDEDVLRSFHRAVGMGTISGPIDRGPRYKPVWSYLAAGEKAEHLYELLEPWLHQRRKERWAELVVQRREYEGRLHEIRSERAKKCAAKMVATRRANREQAAARS